MAAHISYFGCITCSLLSLPYPTTDYDSQTRAKLIQRSTKVLQRLTYTLKNAGLHENFCACSKMYFRTSVLRRSPTITDDYSVHQRSHKALLPLYHRDREKDREGGREKEREKARRREKESGTIKFRDGEKEGYRVNEKKRGKEDKRERKREIG